MSRRRASGILLHPTSLPGGIGIGDLGRGATAFVDFLAAAHQQLWQVLPLGPTGFGDSPYQSFSTFAGNPLLIALDELARDGLLDPAQLAALPTDPGDHIDYGAVITIKDRLLRQVWTDFPARATARQREELAEFVAVNRPWLDDFALFMALKEAHHGLPWTAWPAELRRREPVALTRARRQLAAAIGAQQCIQWCFFRQWQRLRTYAAERGIRLIGDIPIFVAGDSADVWAHPELFQLDEDGQPLVVAGVPPDYFSATGQLWGNPLYRWERHATDGYAWWEARLKATLALVDIVRLDHFRGFEAYWEVPAQETTAVNGRWRPGPAAALFDAIRARLGEVPIIAEDLGLITPAVKTLRDSQGFPGMAILQFGFGGDADNEYLPHNYRPNLVVYTGTHDNDTTIGWAASLDPAGRQHLNDYLGPGDPAEDIAWRLIRLAFASVANTVVVPLQDLLSEDSSARLNTPGRPAGNWGWRATFDDLSAERAARLAHLTMLYGRTAPHPRCDDAAGNAPATPDEPAD